MPNKEFSCRDNDFCTPIQNHRTKNYSNPLRQIDSFEVSYHKDQIKLYIERYANNLIDFFQNFLREKHLERNPYLRIVNVEFDNLFVRKIDKIVNNISNVLLQRFPSEVKISEDEIKNELLSYFNQGLFVIKKKLSYDAELYKNLNILVNKWNEFLPSFVNSSPQDWDSIIQDLNSFSLDISILNEVNRLKYYFDWYEKNFRALRLPRPFKDEYINIILNQADKIYFEIQKLTKKSIDFFPFKVQPMSRDEIKKYKERGAGHGLYIAPDLVKLNPYLELRHFLLNFIHENLHHALPDNVEKSIDILTTYVGCRIGIIQEKSLCKKLDEMR